MERKIFLSKIIYIFFLFFFPLAACTHNNKKNFNEHSQTTEKLNVNPAIAYSNERQDTSKMKKYQTFDEFRMCGIGKVSKSPFVYVKETKDSIWVISSCKQDSVRLYRRISNDIWLNHIEYDMWKKNEIAYKSKECRIARTYDRFFYNDTIVEIHTGFIEGEKYPSVIVKTRKELYEISIDGIKNSAYTNINNLRRYVYDITHSKSSNVWKFYLKESSNNFSYIGVGHNNSYSYRKKAYGLWGIQPGVEETFLYGGIDIREYSDNLASVQIDNPDLICEFADEMPSYPNGIKALKDFCSKKMKKDLLFNNDVNGYDTRVVIEVIIEKDGSITNAKISKSIDSLHDEDALRIVKEMPKWIPAKLNGKHVRCKQLIPITYRK